MSNIKEENTQLLTKKDNTKVEFDLENKKIVYWHTENKFSKLPISQDSIFNEIMSIGKSIDKLGEIKKEPYTNACKLYGGKKRLIHTMEEEFIESALAYEDKYNEYGENTTGIEKKEKNNIISRLKKLEENYGIEFNYSNISRYEKSLIDLLVNIHMLYDFNQILSAINSNKKCESKLWIFTNEDSKELSNGDILNFTKYFFNELYNIRPIIQYDDKTNKPIYFFDSIIEIVIFKMLSIITSCGLNLNEKTKTKICSICGYIYIPTSNNQRFCSNCKRIADNNRQKRCRSKKSKRD